MFHDRFVLEKKLVDAEEAALGFLLPCIPEDVMLSKFNFENEQGVVVNTQHFLALLFKLAKEERQLFMKQLCDRGWASNALLTGLLQAGFSLKVSRELYECLEIMFFPHTDNPAQSDFDSAAVR